MRKNMSGNLSKTKNKEKNEQEVVQETERQKLERGEIPWERTPSLAPFAEYCPDVTSGPFLTILIVIIVVGSIAA